MQLEMILLEPKAARPSRAYNESAGYDLSAFLLNDAGRPMTVTIAPHTTKVIRTGLALRPPRGNLILICSRSGYASRGVFVANAPGVVDPDYTGEIKVALFNGSLEPFYVQHLDRIAQALVMPFIVPSLCEVTVFPRTPRGAHGFGSSDTSEYPQAVRS